MMIGLAQPAAHAFPGVLAANLLPRITRKVLTFMNHVPAIRYKRLEQSSAARINLLWTGGWDSTFRLLQATVCEASVVQPYYVIDHNRQSLRCELSAMASIKDVIADRFPAARTRILPTRLYDRGDVPENEVITGSRDVLLNQSFIGGQYEWLARLAKWQEIPRLEIAVHRDDRAHAFIEGLVERDASGAFAVVAGDSSPAAILFRAFVFPILDMSKLGMATVAKEHGFSDILEMTWFCHEPDARQRPCGKCRPCRYTIQEGLARRIPTINRARAQVFRVYYGVRRRIFARIPAGATSR
jgi:hypothetical protein